MDLPMPDLWKLCILFSPEGISSRLSHAKLRAAPEYWQCPNPTLDLMHSELLLETPEHEIPEN